MSGVTGAERVRSRKDFAQFVDEYREVISNFPGFVSMITSGSYNSDLSKTTFGDIDLIIHFDTWNDKQLLKRMLVSYFHNMSEDIIVPFTSAKYASKRTSNTGELVSVRFHSKTLGYSVQIDNIVALSAEEANFKREFLDLPAEKQGLILGLVKVAAIEYEPRSLFKLLGLKDMNKYPSKILDGEWEFSLSSSKLELRLVHYKPGTTEQLQHDIYWTSQDWNDVKKLLGYNLDLTFPHLLLRVRRNIKNPRSAKRIMGLFKSMVSVKSGEVGTPKGEIKERALTQVALCLTQ
jgi:hypothetical protein